LENLIQPPLPHPKDTELANIFKGGYVPKDTNVLNSRRNAVSMLQLINTPTLKNIMTI
jgi:hypothetical protein